jgi:hypothetical protein
VVWPRFFAARERSVHIPHGVSPPSTISGVDWHAFRLRAEAPQRPGDVDLPSLDHSRRMDRKRHSDRWASHRDEQLRQMNCPGAAGDRVGGELALCPAVGQEKA